MRIHKHETDLGMSVRGVEIPPDDWSGQSGGILITRGVESCIVAGVFDRGKKRGFLGHFSLKGLTEKNDFHDFIIDVGRLTEPRQTSIWMSGASTLDVRGISIEDQSGYNDDLYGIRSETEASLKDLTTGDSTQNWLEANQRIESVVFDVRHGVIHYSTVAINAEMLVHNLQ